MTRVRRTAHARLIAVFVALALCVCFAATGCARPAEPPVPGSSSSAAGTANTPATATAGGSATTMGSAAATTYPAPATTAVVVYLVRNGSLGSSGKRKVLASGPAMGAMVSLLLGPSATDSQAGLSTAIPADTTLGNVKIAGGTATVDLSKQFAAATVPGAQRLRLAQVVYTLTQFHEIRGVAFTVAGTPLKSFGGISLAKPVTRADFNSQLPAIFLGAPLPNQVVTSPLDLTGTANVFEAQFIAELWSPDGKKLASTKVHATSGTGTRGDFDTKLTFSSKKHGNGTLKVFALSAKDGSVIDLVAVPVKM